MTAPPGYYAVMRMAMLAQLVGVVMVLAAVAWLSPILAVAVAGMMLVAVGAWLERDLITRNGER